jgi:two-component system cell cycle response regulator
VRGLEAGADDFLSKPVNDLQLITRVKSLVRLKMLTDELRLRATTAQEIGLEDLLGNSGHRGRGRPDLLLVDARPSSHERLMRMLRPVADVDLETDPQRGLFRAAEGNYECILVSTNFDGFDPLRLCSQLRSLDRTRPTPLMLIADQGEDVLVTRGLEIGVNDYVVRPVDRQELIARLRTQIRRRRYNDRLRTSVSQTFELAVTDSLTGLHNRRYLDNHLQLLFDRAVARKRPLSVLIADIDRFKAFNDAHGHDGGDLVLREFAARLRGSVRGMDLACRFGGEEFVVVMPDTEPEVARTVAERIRSETARSPFLLSDGRHRVAVTVSVGVASLEGSGDSAAELLKRADRALYEAKNGGRNRVVARAA